jgi:hypothetical protein
MKRRLRIITYAWGREYVTNLLDITLAAVLAPGNLPALAGVFDCEFVLLTERGLFELIEKHPVYRSLASIAKARLIAIDDLLVAPLYGLTLTWATYRGMEDLGDEVTNTDFLFFTADWVPADGSYKALIPHLLNGERLIVAPSYCVISEQVLPILRSRIDPESHVLAMPKREMAELGIANRHNTIRGKTINSHLFHMDVIEQFYWLADPHTLLGHQMPIAIVCMRPERWAPKPNTFWDYGTVSELCPNTTPCVLADSDDFLMIELRNESTYDDSLRIGWPNTDTIGKKLAGFVTRDHTVYGRHQLVLHSRDLSTTLDKDRADLNAFVDKVFRHFEGKELPHQGHPYWAFQSSLFDIARKHSNTGIAGDNQPLWSFHSKALTSAVSKEIGDYERSATDGWKTISTLISGKQTQGNETYTTQRTSLSERLSGHLTTLEQALKVQEAIHQRDIALARQSVSELRQLVVERSRDADYRFRKSQGLEPSFTEVSENAPSSNPCIIQRMASMANRIGRHHSMWTPMRHVRRILQAALKQPDIKILWIASDGCDHLTRYTPLATRPHTRMTAFTAAHMEAGDMPWREHFDLCVFDLNIDDLQRLRHMYENVAPALRPGSKALMFYFHEALWRLNATPRFIRSTFPRGDYGHVYYTGSWPSILALRVHRLLNRILRVGSNQATCMRSALVSLLVSAPALIANFQESGNPNQCEMPPMPCSSMTIEIDV